MRLPPKPGGHGGRRPGERDSELDSTTKEIFSADKEEEYMGFLPASRRGNNNATVTVCFLFMFIHTVYYRQVLCG